MSRVAILGALALAAAGWLGAAHVTDATDNVGTTHLLPISAAYASIARADGEVQPSAEALHAGPILRLPTSRAQSTPETPIRVAVRCGTSNYYCNPPTPFCCGTPGKYYCAKDAAGCAQVPPPK